MTQPARACVLALLVIAGGVPLSATATGPDTQGLLEPPEPDVPENATAGQGVNISTNFSIPEDPVRDVEKNFTTRLFVNDTQVRKKTYTVTDGENLQVAFNHTFNETGPREVYINGNLTILGEEYSGASPNVTIHINPEPIEPLNLSTSLPNSTSVGSNTTVSARLSLPESVGVNASGEIQVAVYAENELKKSKSITIGDGENVTVDFSVQFSENGSTPVTISANGTVRNTSLSATVTDSITVEYRFPNETSLTGVSFTVPPSLEDEVATYFEDSQLSDDLNAFVLATTNELYLVVTDNKPQTGRVTVHGAALNENLSARNLTFGVVGANKATFSQQGTPTTVLDVKNNSSDYRLELVRINATHRRITTLTDPDQDSNITVATSAGILIETPLTASEMLNRTGSTASKLVQNMTKNGEVNGSAAVANLIAETERPRLATIRFEEKFWADANATVDGVVLSPGTAARQYVNSIEQANVTVAEDGEPVLYVVQEDFKPKEQENVSEIKQNASALDGEVVAVEANLYQNRFSVQETLEEYTGCNNEVLKIQTPNGPVCVNIVQDVLLHAGVSWNEIPTSRDEVLFVVGASARHQDKPRQMKIGQYRIVGEVVHTSRINESLPNASVLLVYNLSEPAPLNFSEMGEQAQEIIKNRTAQPADSYSAELNESVPTVLPSIAHFENPPTNTDEDSVYEDVNGDGEANIVDVQALYAVRNNNTVQNNPAQFDVNGDGQVDIVDVQALYNEVSQPV